MRPSDRQRLALLEHHYRVWRVLRTAAQQAGCVAGMLVSLSILLSSGFMRNGVNAAERGWLLLEPPLNHSQIDFLPGAERGELVLRAMLLVFSDDDALDRQAPLAEWNQIRSFDSAMECEDLMSGLIAAEKVKREALERRLKAQRKSIPLTDLLTYLGYRQHVFARCVPASAIQATPGNARAWVLWQETRIMTYNKPRLSEKPPEWTLQSAHSTLRECDARAREMVRAQRDSVANLAIFGVEGKVPDARKGFYKLNFEPELPKPGDLKSHDEWKATDRATNGFFVYQCLPDSINPAVESKREWGGVGTQR